MSKYERSSKRIPCPVCNRTKDSDCRWVSDRTLILCHTHQSIDPGISGWKFLGHSVEGAGWGKFVPVEKNPDRHRNNPNKFHAYSYDGRDGHLLMTVEKSIDLEGKKDYRQYHYPNRIRKPGCTPNRAEIPIYNYQAVQQAIAADEPIFWVEGEAAADALIELGHTATTTLGGGKSFSKYGEYNEDVRGARIILCPDKDLAGVTYADEVSQMLGDRVVGWLYAFDNSLWNHLNQAGGPDIEDEIIERKLTKAEILAKVGAKKDLTTGTKPPAAKSDRSAAIGEADELIAEIDRLINDGVYNSRLRAETATLAHKFHQAPAIIRDLYDERLRDAEFKEDRGEITGDITQLLTADRTALLAKQIFPAQLAGAINMRAALLGLRPENYIFTILSAASCCQSADTRIELSTKMGWFEPPVINTGIVAESSQRKTPILKDTIYRPFRRLEQKAAIEYETDYQLYERDSDLYSAYKPKERAELNMPKPIAPVQRMHLLSDPSMEGAIAQSCAHPSTTLFYVRDELAGIFGDLNKYRGGKGSDRQVLLEAFNGASIRSVRASGKTQSHDNFMMGMSGGIQPEVLKKLMGDGEDADGLWSRFLFTIQPTIKAPSMPDRSGSESLDLADILGEIYERIDALPHHIYQLENQSYKLFSQYRDRLEEERINSRNSPAIRHLAGKLQGITARIALTLNAIWGVSKPGTAPNTNIDLVTMTRAIEVAEYALAQARMLAADAGKGGESSGKIYKLLQILKQQGSATIREVQRRVERRSADEARILIEQAVSLGFVKWVDKRSIELVKLDLTSPVPEPDLTDLQVPTPKPPASNSQPPSPDLYPLVLETQSGESSEVKTRTVLAPPKVGDKVSQFKYNSKGKFVAVLQTTISDRYVPNGWAVPGSMIPRDEWGVSWFPAKEEE